MEKKLIGFKPWKYQTIITYACIYWNGKREREKKEVIRSFKQSQVKTQ